MKFTTILISPVRVIWNPVESGHFDNNCDNICSENCPILLLDQGNVECLQDSLVTVSCAQCCGDHAACSAQLRSVDSEWPVQWPQSHIAAANINPTTQIIFSRETEHSHLRPAQYLITHVLWDMVEPNHTALHATHSIVHYISLICVSHLIWWKYDICFMTELLKASL